MKTLATTLSIPGVALFSLAFFGGAVEPPTALGAGAVCFAIAAFHSDGRAGSARTRSCLAIAAALASEGGNRSRAATRLGLSRQGLLNKIARYELA